MALDQILRTEITGILTTSDSDDFPPLANVTHVSGYPPLGNLWQIRIKVLPTGLLIRGSDTVTMAPGEFQRVPQAWWCILT